MRHLLLAYLIINSLLSCLSALSSTSKEIIDKKSIKLPPCRVCKTFIESFKKGLEKTKKGKYEGGDTAWEEEKLGSYASSEIRLVEIQELLCSDVDDGKDQCYHLVDHHDTEIETWWFNKQQEQPDLYKYFCIDTFKYCCPKFHYGPNCTPCKGYPDNICSNNGQCKGAGTRKGNGECNCTLGYTGENCDLCGKFYYEAYRDDKKLLCSKCHLSCAEEGCRKAGPVGCKSCRKGWMLHEEKGCLDWNECTTLKTPCSPLQFCVNTEGSYRCLDCDVSCAGCTGDGPDMCKNCANGFTLVDNMCIGL